MFVTRAVPIYQVDVNIYNSAPAVGSEGKSQGVTTVRSDPLETTNIIISWDSISQLLSSFSQIQAEEPGPALRMFG